MTRDPHIEDGIWTTAVAVAEQARAWEARHGYTVEALMRWCKRHGLRLDPMMQLVDIHGLELLRRIDYHHDDDPPEAR